MDNELMGGNKNALGDIKVSWEKPPKLTDLKSDLEECIPFHQGHIDKIEGWLENLNVTGKAKIKKRKGRSAVVPKLIRKQAEWRYAALTEPFLNTTSLFKASPVTFEDKQSAEQNKLVLNHQFNKEINKNKFFDEYARTAVDEGTVIVKVGWQYEDEVIIEDIPIFDFVPDPEFVGILQEVSQLRESNPNGYETTIPDELKEALKLSEELGTPFRPVATAKTEAIERTRVIENKPTVEICDFRNVFIDPTCKGDSDKANFIVHSFESNKAELLKDDRYHNLESIGIDDNSILGEPDHTSDTGASTFNFSDDVRKKFVVFEYSGFIDVTGDGKLTSVIISWVGDTFIRMEENPFPDKKLPFVIATYLPVRKSVYGESDGALLEDNQKILGAITRGMIDVVGRSANGQIAMRRDMLDPVNQRKFENGDNYKFNAAVDPQSGIHMHQAPEMPASVQYLHQLQNHEAESLTGVKAYSGGLSGDALGDVATAVRGVLDAASKREMAILRRLADGVIQIGKKFASMNGEFLSDTEVIRITNEEFVTVRKDELQGKFDLELTISTAEEDAARADKLEFMLQTMANTVDFSITQLMLVEQATLRKMPDLAEAIKNYQPQPDPHTEQMQALEIQKLQAEIEEIKSKTVENYAEAKLDGAKTNETQASANQKDLDFIQDESGVTQARELQKQTEQSKGNMQLKAFENELDNEKAQKESNEKINQELLRAYLKESQGNKAA